MNQDIDRQLQILQPPSGADYFGVADLTSARDCIPAQGGEWVARYPRGIVIGIELAGQSCQPPAGRIGKAAAIVYKHNSYDVVNQIARPDWRPGGKHAPAIRDIVPFLYLHQNGLLTRTSAGSSPRNWRHILPVLAGSERAACSSPRITGPASAGSAVLTDAPLQPTGIPMEPRCGDCTACVDICPQNAFTGRMFCSEDEPREARFDAAACDRYFREMEKKAGCCGLRTVSVCLPVWKEIKKFEPGNNSKKNFALVKTWQLIIFPRFSKSVSPAMPHCRRCRHQHRQPVHL